MDGAAAPGAAAAWPAALGCMGSGTLEEVSSEHANHVEETRMQQLSERMLIMAPRLASEPG